MGSDKINSTASSGIEPARLEPTGYVNFGLTGQQWQVLRDKFLLIPAFERDKQFSAPLTQLLDPGFCNAFLDELAVPLGAPNAKITASLLSKRLAFLFTAGPLVAMTLFNQALDLSVENVILEFRHDQMWQSRLPLLRLQTGPFNIVQQPQDRDAWRERMLHRLFAGNLSIVWDALRASSGVSSNVLWENLAVRIFSLYERRMHTLATTDIERARIEDDFDYIVRRAPGEIFGLSRNPLTRFHLPFTPQAGKPVRFRRTCCFYFRATRPPEYCTVCPLLRSKEK